MDAWSSSSATGHWLRSPRRGPRQRGATVASSSSPASPGSARPRSSPGSSRDLDAERARAARHLRRPLDPAAARPDPRSRRHACRRRSRRRSPPARAPHEIQSLLIAELELPPRPTVLVLEDVHWADDATLDVDHRARPADRVAAGAARPHLPRRRGAAGPSAARGRRRDPRRRLARPRARAALGRARSRRSPATAPTTSTPRPAATRSTSPSCSPRARPTSCRRSIANAVLGRVVAARRGRAAAGGAGLGRADPRRAPRVLDAVMPDWPAAAEEPERRQLLEVDPRYVRFRHELARNAIRSSIPIAARRRLHARDPRRRCSPPTPIPADIVHHAEAAGAEDVVAEYALVAARRAAALESNREAYSHYRRAADFVDRLPPPSRRPCSRSWRARRTRSAGSRTPSRRSSARSRVYGELGDEAARRPLHAGPVPLPLVRRRRRRRARRRRSRRSRSSSRSASRSSSPAPTAASSQLAMLAEDTDEALALGRARARARDPARRRAARAPTRSSTSAARRLQLDHARDRDAARGARDRRRGRRPARGDARARQPRLHADVLGAARSRRCAYAQQALAYAEEHEVHNARLVRRDRRSPGCGCAPASGTRPSGSTRGRAASGASSVAQLLAKTVLAELAVRRGDPDAAERLADLAAQADRTGEPQRIAPVARAGDRVGADDRRADADRAVRAARSTRRGRADASSAGAQSAWRLGGRRRARRRARPAERRRRTRRCCGGDWRGAADAFGDVGWTYDRALMLSLLDDEESLVEAIEIAREPRRGAADAARGRAHARARPARAAGAARGDARESRPG